jgi:hypothetical protein
MSEISNKENESTITSSPSPNELKKTVKIQELPCLMNHITPAGISRERSFIRPASNPQNHQGSWVRNVLV